jgi:membrane protein involved in colicin uptake
MTNRGFPYNTIVTRVSFDHSVSFPKLEFNAVRPLTDDEADEIIQLLNDHEFADKIEAVLAKDLEVVPTNVEADDEPLFEEPPKAEPKAKAKAPAKKAEPKAEPEPEKEEVATTDESDDELDAELDDILGSLDNLD